MTVNPYTLTLDISKKDLQTLSAAGLNITLAKPVDNQPVNVAWQVFRPFPTNTVTWEENYGLYASKTQITNGAKIQQSSSVALATGNQTYPLKTDSTFGTPESPGAGKGVYSITNQYKDDPALTFGLTQGAKVNGAATGFKPLSAQLVPSSMRGDFTPLTTLYVWLQVHYQSETVITQVTSPQTKVVFGASTTEQNLTFDAKQGMFVPAGDDSAELAKYLDSAFGGGEERVRLGGGVELIAPRHF